MREWLKDLGFHYNPFEYLEASQDPNLHDYMVGLDTFSLAWEPVSALIFASAGGGKTAMRIYTARSCWFGPGSLHTLPISYYLPNHYNSAEFFTREAHWPGLAQAAATSLLTAIIYQPQRYLNSAPAVQAALVSLLDCFLLSPLERYLDILESVKTGGRIPALLDPAFAAPQAVEIDKLEALCAGLRQALRLKQPCQDDPAAGFDDMLQLSLDALGFRSIYLLLDGVDSYPSINQSPAGMARAVAPLLAQVPGWEARHIHLKGFLPLEVEEEIQRLLPAVDAPIGVTGIQWDVPRLAEVIRRRVYRATQGMYGSLDAISAQEVRDVETYLAKSCQPLPRELLRLVDTLLIVTYQRIRGQDGQVEMQDILEAQKRQQVSLGVD